MAPTVPECQERFTSKVREYQAMFESSGAYYHNIEWLTTALANARAEFDACMALAQS
jgi:hypothetical protein